MPATSQAAGPWLDTTSPRRYKDLIARWISHLAGHGVKSVFWRGMYVGKATYHSRVMPVMLHADAIIFAGSRYPGTGAAETLKEFNQLAAAIERFDDFHAARQESKRQGLAFYADISPFDKFFPGLDPCEIDSHKTNGLLSWRLSGGI